MDDIEDKPELDKGFLPMFSAEERMAPEFQGDFVSAVISVDKPLDRYRVIGESGEEELSAESAASAAEKANVGRVKRVIAILEVIQERQE